VAQLPEAHENGPDALDVGALAARDDELLAFEHVWGSADHGRVDQRRSGLRDERREIVDRLGSRRAHFDEALAVRPRERAGRAAECRAERVGVRETRDDDVHHLDGLRSGCCDDADAEVLGA